MPDEAPEIPAGPPIRPVSTTPPVTPISHRPPPAPPRRGLSPRSLVVVLAAVAVAVGAIWYAVARDRGAETVASAVLTFDATSHDPLGEHAVSTLRLVDDAGALHLRFDEAALPASELGDTHHLEMWIVRIDDDGTIGDVVSLGVVDDIGRPYPIPPGFDPIVHRIVDISVESGDGDPGHSGRTILRGELVTTD